MLPYVVLASLWLYLSERLVLLLFRDRAQIAHAESLRDVVFAVVSGTLLFFLVRWVFARAVRAEESARFQAHLLKNSGEAFIASDPQGRIIYMNDFAQELYGWPVADAIGRNVAEVTVPGISQPEAGEIMEQLRKGQRWSGEFLVRRRDGTVFPAQVTDAAVRDERGEIVAIIGISQDITEQKAAEKEIAMRTALLEEAEALAHSGSWEWDIVHDTMRWSDESFRIIGIDPASFEANIRAFIAHVHPDDRAKVKAAIDTALADGRPYQVEFRVVRQDGAARTVQSRGRVLRDENGKPLRLIGMSQDVTQEREAAAALRESESRLRALAARLNEVREEEALRIARELHDELGQALTGIIMEIAAVERQIAPENATRSTDELRRRLADIHASLDQTIAITRRICLELRPALLDQLGLIPAVEWQTRDFESRSGIFCNVVLPEQPPEVSPQVAVAIFRILQEILTNIARHANATELTVELTCGDHRIRLSVVDNGCGATRREMEKPPGLGLIGMRERALAAGGELSISSDARGTRVVVTLPQMRENNGDESETADPGC